MSDVLQFKPRKKSQPCYECNCGRQDFFINEDTTIECRGCGIITRDHQTYSPQSHRVVPKE